MRRTLPVIALLMAIIWSKPALSGGIENLSWLSGCWTNPKGEAGSGEYWQPLAGETMLGIGRTVRNGKTVQYEYLRLHTDEQDRVVYTATPSRQRETAFVATQVTDRAAVFENPTHDFPQKITYTREGDEGMLVRIEGPRQGQSRAIDFRFSRVLCPK